MFARRPPFRFFFFFYNRVSPAQHNPEAFGPEPEGHLTLTNYSPPKNKTKKKKEIIGTHPNFTLKTDTSHTRRFDMEPKQTDII